MVEEEVLFSVAVYQMMYLHTRKFQLYFEKYLYHILEIKLGFLFNYYVINKVCGQMKKSTSQCLFWFKNNTIHDISSRP